ncbi:hypothetical protein FRC15_003038 [Serendipita sp. 397]|nr:hypothetical protein FRC15_003038 [Serendipita sp. 397]
MSYSPSQSPHTPNPSPIGLQAQSPLAATTSPRLVPESSTTIELQNMIDMFNGPDPKKQLFGCYSDPTNHVLPHDLTTTTTTTPGLGLLHNNPTTAVALEEYYLNEAQATAAMLMAAGYSQAHAQVQAQAHVHAQAQAAQQQLQQQQLQLHRRGVIL